MFTSLEELPNEILLEIFSYAKFRDLSIALWNLNRRFDELLRSLKCISLVLNQAPSSECLLFSRQIRRLVVVTSASINFNCFGNVRSLIFNWATGDHLKQIRSETFPELIYLSLPMYFTDQWKRSLITEIFSNQFPLLRYADLGALEIPDVLSRSPSLSLRSLRIVSLNINIIPFVLRSGPHLTHLQVQINENNHLEKSSLPLLYNHPLQELIFMQSRTSTTIFDMSEIFYSIPYLKRLDLLLYTQSLLHLLQFIAEAFLHLNRFHCHIIHTEEKIDLTSLRRIHRCYSSIEYTISCLETMIDAIRLEYLPNELLMEIFVYLNARELYRAFYNLNSRLNVLLNSLGQLCLVLSPASDDSYDDLFASRVSSLVVEANVHLTFSRYVNVRRLILSNSKHDHLSQIMREGSHLESISLIAPRCFYTTFTFHEMIFSNQFSLLKSSYLTSVYSPSLEVRQLSWSQSPSLRSLRITSRDSLIHLSILNACPNLHSLQLSLDQLDPTPPNTKPHRNLQRLKLILTGVVWPSDETIFETFFLCMPCLKQLIIQRSATLPEHTSDLLRFDWLAGVVGRQLASLKQFRFNLHLHHSDRMNSYELEHQMQTNFVGVFRHDKKSHLYINAIEFPSP